jgi:hypothetical protein
MFKTVLDGRLYLAPIGANPTKILDIGTGFGHWALDGGLRRRINAFRACALTFAISVVADALRGTHVIGVDLSPIQPVWVPHNLEFRVDDIEDEWALGSDFDYIHLRGTTAALKNPAGVAAKTFRCVHPLTVPTGSRLLNPCPGTFDLAVGSSFRS